MSDLTEHKAVLLTITGPDQPGITSALTEVLARAGVVLLDIEQVVVQGQLTLCLLTELEPTSEQGQTVLKQLREVSALSGQTVSHRKVALLHPVALNLRRYVLTVLGDPISAQVMHEISAVLARYEANIDSIRRLSAGGLSSLEIELSLQCAQEDQLKKELLQCLSDRRIDIALQRESLTRRNKRLVAMDMDSTLIQIEVIDEIARLHNQHDAVAKITEAAMRGEMDFAESLKQRVSLLAGFEAKHLDAVVRSLPLSPGAEQMVQVLKGLGYQVGIISGGFQQAADFLKERLGLDFAYANALEIEAGRLTGRVCGSLIDAHKKAEILSQTAQASGIRLEQTVAIGDGANDLHMLARAGLGIAFHGKQLLKQSAHTSVSSGGLDRILYLLGMNARDIDEFLTGR